MNSSRALAALLMVLCLLPLASSAQNRSGRTARLSDAFLKSGEVTLRTFAPISKMTRDSIVKLDLDGTTVALATVIDANGFALTKASEIKDGKLTAVPANGTRLDTRLVTVDEGNDVALVRIIRAPGLRPIRWSPTPPSVGQWAVTPGTELTPEAVGIVSVLPRKILHKQALIGVQLDFNAPTARIGRVLEGLGAEKAGLKSGDVILAVNGTPVNKGEELTATLRKYRDGQTVQLRVQRQEQEFETSVSMAVPKPERLGRWADRQDRMNRLGTELSERAEGFELAIQHDTVLQPWQCGGPLVDLEGRAIGLNIARAGRIASYALPATLVREIIEDLKASARTPVKRTQAAQ